MNGTTLYARLAAEDNCIVLLLEESRHQENIFTNRCNYFLVGQAMMFSGAATLLVSKETAVKYGLELFCGTGAFLALIWCIVNIFHHRKTRDPLQKNFKLALNKALDKKNKADDKEPEPKVDVPYLHEGNEDALWGKSHFWMGGVVPVALLIAWVILFRLC